MLLSGVVVACVVDVPCAVEVVVVTTPFLPDWPRWERSTIKPARLPPNKRIIATANATVLSILRSGLTGAGGGITGGTGNRPVTKRPGATGTCTTLTGPVSLTVCEPC